MSTSTSITSKRRRFLAPLQQPSIAAFLTPHDHSPSSTSSVISPSGLLSPSIPRAVQVSLLQVGMRTRKAVADGYKTTPKPSIIYNDNNPSSSLSASSSSPASSSSANAAFAERLRAFKATPPTPLSPHRRALMFAELILSLSAPAPSTLTSTSTTSMPPPSTSRKRALSATDDEPAPDSPILSYAITSPTLSEASSPVLRAIAQPKTRKGVPLVTSSCGAWDWDEEMSIYDFGGVAFLEL